MEKTDSAWVVELKSEWSDLGSWDSVWDYSNKDANGNVVSSNTFLTDCTDCLVESQGKLLVGIGLDDVVIVDTPDAILVSKKYEPVITKRVEFFKKLECR